MMTMAQKSGDGTGASSQIPSISFDKEQHKTSRRSQRHSVAFTDPEPAKMPVHSGLSALILAATSQLGPLAEAATQCSDASDLSIAQISHGDGYVSSHDEDNGMRSSTPPRNRLVPSSSSSTAVSVSTKDRDISRTRNRGGNANGHHATRNGDGDDGKHHPFPEVLMTLLLDPSNRDIVTFLPDGKFFAMRSKEFAEEVMRQHFTVESFEEFLELVHDWGFTRIDDGSDDENTSVCSGIQVFRHPQFHKGSRSYMAMKYGQSPTEVRMSVIPDRAKIELSLSDDSMASQTNTADSNPKRRLSPTHLRRQSETSTTSQRQRIGFEQDVQMTLSAPLLNEMHALNRRGSLDSSGEHRSMSRRASIESRSLALAITTEKLNLECNDADKEPPAQPNQLKALVDDGVERATRNIVGDAIESLLWDETHTRETYLKHARELSTSTLPGVVPISKQLFSPEQMAQLSAQLAIQNGHNGVATGGVATSGVATGIAASAAAAGTVANGNVRQLDGQPNGGVSTSTGNQPLPRKKKQQKKKQQTSRTAAKKS